MLKNSVLVVSKWALLATLILVASLAHAEFSDQELETFNNEPPMIRALLERAVLAERDEQNVDGDWQAAKLYCAASRHGSAEG